MDSEMVAIAGFASLFCLMLLRVPVGMAMGLVGISGFGYLTGFAPAMKLVGQTTMRTVTDYTFGVIPMFLLMGAFVSVSGISRELFRAANTFVGHWRGGLGIATIAACGGFAAISGSSVATAATFSAVAYPEMRRYNYPQSFATGVIAVGGTLGAMLPPSTVLAVYGIITQQDIGKLFISGILPGLLAIAMHMITIAIIGYVRPGFLPAGPRSSWGDRVKAIGDVWSPLLLFVFVIGGLYGGLFIPTEAGAVGAVGAFAIGVLRGRLSGAGILQALLQATRTAAAVFTVLIGALCFGYFLTITQTPQHVTQFLTGLGIGPYGVLGLILLMYLVLGCLMDAMAMIILTVPIVFPVVSALGFDPIWFGIVIVLTVELGLIHPPVGMNVFVIKSVIKDVSMATIFAGVLPFVATDLIRLAILVLFPALATWGDKGTLFVGTWDAGTVSAVTDQGGKRTVKTAVKGLRMATGVAFANHTLYVVDIDKVYAWENPEDHLDNLGPGKVVYDDFPPYTPHGWKYITVGQSGELYIPVGPPCNECLPPSGTSQVRRINAENGNAELWAIGVRNSVGGAVDPRTGNLWFTENARDWLGDDVPSDKLNLVTKTGEDFGYPYCHQGDILDPVYGKGHSCAEFNPPVVKLGPHVAPLGMKFYTGNQFPAEYSGNIFIAEHGSWNRHQKNGYRIERVMANPDGSNASQEVFASGFTDGTKVFGRPADIIQAPDGSLLVADDQAHAVYQISYSGK